MKILCYGDSNTFGWDPQSYFGGRYDHPWPELLARLTDASIRTDAACGREIPARAGVYPKDTDLLILLLGTNDLLQGSSAHEAAERMDAFLTTIRGPAVLLIAPPPMCRGEWVPNEELIVRSLGLAEEYRKLALSRGIRFLDAGDWQIPMAFDGVHFTEEGHRRFAQALAAALASDITAEGE